MKRVLNRDKLNNTNLKIRFYIMSLWLLFVLIFLLTIDVPIYIGPDAKFIGIIPLLKKNVLPLTSALMAFFGWLLACKMRYEWAGVANPTHVIKSVKNENYEYLTFLTTYIIPLICIDLTNIRYVIVLGILLILVGSIFVKMDLYYGNPTLALLGYKLYRADVEGVSASDGIILLSKERLSTAANIEWIAIDEYVWVARRIDNDSARVKE